VASGADSADADQHLKGAAMDELNARAVLVQAPDVSDGLTTSVSREEVQRALDVEDGSPELILDLTRFADGDPTDTRSVAVAWERKDLQEFLRETSGDRVMLTFDRGMLQEAMDADVEAHGLREKVLVLAVAATAATGAASSAAAYPVFEGSSGPAIQSTLGPDDRAVSRAIPAAEATLGPDDRAVSRAIPAAEATLGPDDRAVSRSIPAPEPTMGVDDRAVSRSIPAPESTLGVDDRAVSRATSDFATPEPGGGSDVISLPNSTETIGIGAAIALAITGAAFVAGRRRGGQIRPA
jgi:hypothetical protein